MRTTLPLLALLASSLVADKVPPEQERLATLQSLVGDWRGVAQPQRGSTKDNWTEAASWVWDFQNGPALVGKPQNSRYFREWRLTAASDDGQFVLLAVPLAGDQPLRYLGRFQAEQWVFTAENAPAELPQRLTLRFTAGGDRQLLLLEKQTASGSFARIAEIGYTRQGSGFGKNVTQRECVVTGGLGTIEVTHNGKSYYVCCTGCRDYFNQNPEKVLADYAARKK